MNTETPVALFVDIWWCSVLFHLVMYFPMWLTKAGRWSEMWDGGR